MNNGYNKNFTGTFDSNGVFVGYHTDKNNGTSTDQVYEFDIKQSVEDIKTVLLNDSFFDKNGYYGRLGANIRFILSHEYNSPDNALEFYILSNDPGFGGFIDYWS